MRKALFLLLLCFAALGHARTYDRAELEALLAPVTLYPDSLISHILIAASYPEQVAEAARGVPAAPHWHPSVKALVPYPDVLRRMAESPQWMDDLAEAHVHQQPQVMATIAELRTRAHAYGQAPTSSYPPAVVYGQTLFVWPSFSFGHFHHHHRHRHHGHRLHAPQVRPYRRVPESQRAPIINSTPRLFNKPSSRGLFHKPR